MADEKHLGFSRRLIQHWSDEPTYVDDLLARALALGPPVSPDDTLAARMDYLRERDAEVVKH